MDYLGNSLDSAERTSYDNATSTLTATNVQDAIDETKTTNDGKVDKPADGTTADLTVPRFTDTNGGELKTITVKIDDSGNITGATTLATSLIKDPTAASSISLNATSVNISAANFTVNTRSATVQPVTITDTAVVLWGTGTTLKNSSVLIDGSNNITGTATSDVGTSSNKWRNLYLSSGVVSDTQEYFTKRGTSSISAPASAGVLVTGGNNVMVGTGAGTKITTLGNNSAFGNNTLKFNTGGSNTAIGTSALNGVDGVSTGGANTVCGHDSTKNLTTGTRNCAFGRSSAVAITTGADIVCIGDSSNVVGTLDNQIAIGSAAITTAANECVIGNALLERIRPMSNGTVCDLGSSSFKFKDLHMAGSIVGTAYSTFYFSGTAATAVTTAYKEVAGTAADWYPPVGFTRTGNVLTYTGIPTKLFKITTSFSVSSAGADTYTFAIGFNGTSGLTSSEITQYLSTTTPTAVTISMIQSLATNNTIRLVVKGATGGINCTVSKLNFTIHQI